MTNMQSPPIEQRVRTIAGLLQSLEADHRAIIEQCEQIMARHLQSLEDAHQALLAIEVNPGEYPTNATIPFANKIDDVKNLLADIRTQMAAV